MKKNHRCLRLHIVLTRLKHRKKIAWRRTDARGNPLSAPTRPKHWRLVKVPPNGKTKPSHIPIRLVSHVRLVFILPLIIGHRKNIPRDVQNAHTVILHLQMEPELNANHADSTNSPNTPSIQNLTVCMYEPRYVACVQQGTNHGNVTSTRKI